MGTYAWKYICTSVNLVLCCSLDDGLAEFSLYIDLRAPLLFPSNLLVHSSAEEIRKTIDIIVSNVNDMKRFNFYVHLPTIFSCTLLAEKLDAGTGNGLVSTISLT